MDSYGVVHEKMVRTGYLTATPLSEPEEAWSRYKEPFIVDTEWYIIYLDNHPELWAKLEGHLEHSPAPKDHTSMDDESNDIPSRIAKIKQCANEMASLFLHHQCVFHYLCIQKFLSTAWI